MHSWHGFSSLLRFRILFVACTHHYNFMSNLNKWFVFYCSFQGQNHHVSREQMRPSFRCPICRQNGTGVWRIDVLPLSLSLYFIRSLAQLQHINLERLQLELLRIFNIYSLPFLCRLNRRSTEVLRLQQCENHIQK